jgi:hypothetical protein
MRMNLQDIAILRLANQRIAGAGFLTAKDTIGWMGAMQAQDLAMAKWAVGIRTVDSTEQSIEEAINAGEILRTHLLRPTLHLVSAENNRWMLELSAPQIKSALKSRNNELGLTGEIVAKSNRIIENALKSDSHLTREELMAELVRGGINADNNRGYHLILFAELDGLICSGRLVGKNLTYSLMDQRTPKIKHWTRDESLVRLAGLYFSSRGPATLQDFIWWARLSTIDAKRALEMAGPELDQETVDSQVYWFSKFQSNPIISPDEVYLLPAFDEYIICYADRTASLLQKDFNKAVSSNGIFRPVIVVNGRVIGIWKKEIKKDKLIVKPNFFASPDKSIVSKIENAANRYGSFFGKKTEVDSTTW